MKFESMEEAVQAIFGYAAILTGIIDAGLDPLLDTDVRAYIQDLDISVGATEEVLQAAVDQFYEIYDMALNA